MAVKHKYHASDKMSDLICDNYSLLMVMSRFGISLGFGDRTVKQVCELNHVHTNTFLAVANFICEEQFTYDNRNSDISIEALTNYLRQAHTYFLEYNLPAIRAKLAEAIGCHNEVATLILRFFDVYAKEVRRHMEYENKMVFNYVDKLLKGEPTSFNIQTYANKHNQEIEMRINELKRVIIKYYPETERNDKLNAVLFDIFNCEQDLASHCQVEDYLFVPAVAQMERSRANA